MRYWLLGGCLLATTAHGAQLEWLPGFSEEEGSVHAIDVSDDGAAILGAIGAAPVVWRDGGIVELEAPEGYGRVEALGLAPDGSAAVGHGTVSDYVDGSGTLQDPIRWDAAGKPTVIGPPSDQLFTYATDASNGGEAIVGLFPAAPDYFGPARWTAASGWQPIAPGGGDVARISADGRVIAGNGLGEAFRWTVERGFEGLGSLPGGDDFSFAVAISSNGAYVAGHAATERGQEVFLWSEATGMRSILDMTPDEPYRNLVPTGVSNAGAIVGIDWFSTADSLRAFVWDADHGVRYLDDFLPEPGDTRDALLDVAHAISADGQTIVGASVGEQSGAWVLRLAVPEPASLLVAIACLAIGATGRRA